MFRPKRRRKSTTSSSSYSPLKSEQFNDSIYNSSTDSSTRPSDSEGSYRFHAAKIQQSRSFDTKRTTATITMRRRSLSRTRSTSRSRGEIGDPQRISRISNSRGRQSSSSGEQKLQQRVDTPPPTAPNSNIGSQHNGASGRGRGGRSVPFTSRGSRAASPKHNGSSSVREEQEGLKTKQLSPPLPSPPPPPPPGKSPPRTRQSALDGNAKSLNLLSSQLSGLNFEDGTTPRDTLKADTTAPTIVAAAFDTALVPRSRSCSSESRERMPFLPSLSSNKRDHSLSRALAAGGERSSNALVAKEEYSSALVAREEPEYSLVASGEHLSNALVVAEKSFNELIVTDDRVSQDQSRLVAENSHSGNDEEVAGERTLALGHSYRPKSSYSNTPTPEVNCDDITPKTSQKGRRRFDSTAFSTTDNSLSLQEVNKIDFKDLADFVTGRKGKEALASIDVEDDSMLCSANDGTPSSKVKEAVNTKKIEKIVKKVSKMRPLERSLYRSRFFPPKRTLDSTNWKSQSSLDVLPPPPINF
eukprot:g14899.t1 g14899   contig21:107912-110471(-)